MPEENQEFYWRCPECDERLRADVEVYYYGVPLFQDGYVVDCATDSQAEIRHIYCPSCNWEEPDGHYYHTGEESEAEPDAEQEYFPVVRLSRGDLVDFLDDPESISDDDMSWIAEMVCEAVLGSQYWDAVERACRIYRAEA